MYSRCLVLVVSRAQQQTKLANKNVPNGTGDIPVQVEIDNVLSISLSWVAVWVVDK